MNSTANSVGILLAQLLGVIFCTICGLAIVGLPFLYLGYSIATGITHPQQPAPFSVLVEALVLWSLLIKIFVMSIDCIHNFSWQTVKKIAAYTVLFICGLIITYLLLP